MFEKDNTMTSIAYGSLWMMNELLMKCFSESLVVSETSKLFALWEFVHDVVLIELA
jgi:hypothetical protein